MPEYTVKESGGDFPNLSAALAYGSLANGDVIRVQGIWSGPIDERYTYSVPNVAIIFEQGSEVDLTGQGAGNHYRAYSTSSGHIFTQSAPGMVIEGMDLRLTSANGTSGECIRVNANDLSGTFRKCCFWASEKTSQQDGVYLLNRSTLNPGYTFEQCIFYGFERSGVNWSRSSGIGGSIAYFHYNSCLFYQCGNNSDDNRYFGAMHTRQQGGTTELHVDALNCWSLDCKNPSPAPNSRGSFIQVADEYDGGSSNGIYRFAGCIVQDDNFTALDAFAASVLQTDTLENHAITDNASPGAGSWVIVEDLVPAPPIFLLVDNPSDNAAQGMHSNTSIYGLTVPATDAAGNSRSAPHDVGPFVVVTGAGPIVLVVENMTHGHGLDGGLALTQAHSLTVDDVAHGHALEGDLTLESGISLAPANMAHGHQLEGDLGLSQGHLLAPAEMAHEHRLEGGIPLSQGYTLAPDGMLHGHQLDGGLGLSQGYILVLSKMAHGHVVEEPTLILGESLSVADMMHLHALDGPLALTQAHILAIDDMLHGHQLGGVALVPGFTLAPDDMLHGHLAEEPTLIFGLVLAVGDAMHAHSLDGVNLIQSHILSVSDSWHGHYMDSPALISGEFEPGCVIKVPVENRIISVPLENRRIKLKLC